MECLLHLIKSQNNSTEYCSGNLVICYGVTVVWLLEGLHLEGPFISKDKRGAHLLESITDMKNGISDVLSVYKSLDNVAMVTIAPEIPGALEVIAELHRKGIVVSLGKFGLSQSTDSEIISYSTEHSGLW